MNTHTGIYADNKLDEYLININRKFTQYFFFRVKKTSDGTVSDLKKLI